MHMQLSSAFDVCKPYFNPVPDSRLNSFQRLLKKLPLSYQYTSISLRNKNFISLNHWLVHFLAYPF